MQLQAPASLAREFERRQLAYASDNGGQPPFHPRMMLVLLLYAYSAGVFSSRKIMQRSVTDAAFRVIVGEADHVLNIAFNLLAGGRCLEQLELRRNDRISTHWELSGFRTPRRREISVGSSRS